MLSACVAMGRRVNRGASRATDGEEEGAYLRAGVMVLRIVLPLERQYGGGAAPIGRSTSPAAAMPLAFLHHLRVSLISLLSCAFFIPVLVGQFPHVVVRKAGTSGPELSRLLTLKLHPSFSSPSTATTRLILSSTLVSWIRTASQYRLLLLVHTHSFTSFSAAPRSPQHHSPSQPCCMQLYQTA